MSATRKSKLDGSSRKSLHQGWKVKSSLDDLSLSSPDDLSLDDLNTRRQSLEKCSTESGLAALLAA